MRVRTVFLDRDGTVNVKAREGHYITRPEDLALLPGAAAAVRRLNDAGACVVLVSNQRGIALGHMTETDHQHVLDRLRQLLAAEGAWVDAAYHCPHERDSCGCRKPAPGMLLLAAREVTGVDLTAAAIVGDTASDVRAGRALGLLAVRIADTSKPEADDADHVAADLADAVEWLLAERDEGDDPR